MEIISGIYWDKGRRENNQDSLMLEQVYTRRGRVLLAVVSDGIGGLAEGETASGFIIEKLLQNFYQEILILIAKGRGKKALKKSFLRCFFEINQLLNQYGKSKEIRLGATVSLLLVWKKNYLLMHLGDSHIYQIKKGVQKMTKDHSAGGSVLTRCMGSFAYEIPDLRTGRIRGKTGFLLCTDGFDHYIREEMLLDALEPKEIHREEQIDKRLKQLVSFEMKQGEKDNISAIYLICSK